MCAWGTDTLVRVKIAAHLSHTGQEYWCEKGIDSCIAPLVKALQDAGIDMLASCCGHGETDGYIHLADGRVLTISPKREEIALGTTEGCRGTCHDQNADYT